jgi:hypothetical protein
MMFFGAPHFTLVLAIKSFFTGMGAMPYPQDGSFAE